MAKEEMLEFDGVVDEVLARAIRGHDWLSSLARTYDDYTRVIERAVATAENQVPLADRQRALAAAYLRNARGAVFDNRFRDAWRCTWRPNAPQAMRALPVMRAARACSRSSACCSICWAVDAAEWECRFRGLARFSIPRLRRLN